MARIRAGNHLTIQAIGRFARFLICRSPTCPLRQVVAVENPGTMTAIKFNRKDLIPQD